jgi:hypothetical protein
VTEGAFQRFRVSEHPWLKLGHKLGASWPRLQVRQTARVAWPANPRPRAIKIPPRSVVSAFAKLASHGRPGTDLKRAKAPNQDGMQQWMACTAERWLRPPARFNVGEVVDASTD